MQQEAMNVTISSYSSCAPKSYIDHIEILSIIQLIIALVAIGGNSLVIVSVYKVARLRTITNYFVVSLAAADLLVALNVPLYVSFYFKLDLACNVLLCRVRYWFTIFSSGCSMLSMVGVAVDRFVAILFALHYNRMMKRQRALTYIIFVWIFMLFISTLPFLGIGTRYYRRPRYICDLQYIFTREYILIIVAGLVMTSTLITTALYYMIFKEAWKQLKAVAAMDLNCGVRQETRTACTMALVLGVCLLGYVPYFVIVVLPFMGLKEEYNYIALNIKPFVVILYFGKSALNPIIYGWKAKDFRHAFLRLLFKKKNNNSFFPT